MLKIALTGNIGSGKTTVCRFFEVLGVPVYYADQRARLITRTPGVLDEIRSTFGHDVFEDGNRLNRQKLAQVVFNDQQALNTLNKIIHPRVYLDYQHWLNQHAHVAYTIQEAAVIFEAGHEKRFDRIVVVGAPRQVRLQRVIRRENATCQEVEQRMKNQLDQEVLEKKAHHVIVNDDRQAVIPQVLALHAEWAAESFKLHEVKF